MSRAFFTIKNEAERRKVIGLIEGVPVGTRVEVKKARRSLPQNDLLWLRLTDIARKKEWHGRKLKPADWKDIMTAALRNADVVPGLDPGTFVSLGLHTSDMTKEEMGLLLDLIDCFASEHEIQLSDHNATGIR